MATIENRASRERAFGQGLLATSTLGGLLLILFYTLAAHTPDIRARLVIMFSNFDASLIMALAAIFIAVGTVASLFVRAPLRAAAPGIGIGTLACMALLQSGIVSRMVPPTHYEGSPRYVFASIAAVVAGTVLWRARRSTRHAA